MLLPADASLVMLEKTVELGIFNADLELLVTVLNVVAIVFEFPASDQMCQLPGSPELYSKQRDCSDCRKKEWI